LIEERERSLCGRFFEGIQHLEGVELVGNVPPENRVPIISFNIRHQNRYLHPRFVTKLLNDLFGIQSRAGCSCAGPYGHYLLDIDDPASNRLRQQIAMGNLGIKPGWVRLNLHYTLEESDIDFILEAIEFVARNGHLFLRKYRLNMSTAEWSHVEFAETDVPFSIENDFAPAEIEEAQRQEARKSYFVEAERLADQLGKEPEPTIHVDKTEIEAIKFYYDYDHAG